ncbi:MAG: YggS family pyridoxal phosphate-dependent enzyme [Candidatus Limnocylindria bacterium]
MTEQAALADPNEPRATASMVDALRRAHAEVRARIDAACARADRPVDAVTLVAVSKTVDPDRLRAAVEVGLTTLGENRVQEGERKRPEVPGATWHLIGPLQSNKAKRALGAFDLLETVTSVDLGARLDRLVPEVRPGARFPVLVQVNVDRDPAKAGVLPDDAAAVVDGLAALPNLEVHGLMTIGRFGAAEDEARRTFRALRDLSTALRGRMAGLGPELSMGMSDDYEIAVEEGATIVRVGRALFGERSHRHGDGPADHRHR